MKIYIFFETHVLFLVLAVKVPLDAYMMDFVFSEKEDGGIFDNKNGMDYHIPVFGGIAKEPPMHIVHISVEMAPIAKVSLGYVSIFSRDADL
jgi:starch synthase